MNIWVVLALGLSWIMVEKIFLCKCLQGHTFPLLLGIYIEMKLLDHMVTLCLIFWGTNKPFPKAAAPFYIPTGKYESSVLSTSLWRVWNGITLWLWFALPWRLTMLSIFSCAYWPFVCRLWRHGNLEQLIFWGVTITLSNSSPPKARQVATVQS